MTIQADTSKQESETCLLQNHKPIAFTSKSIMNIKTRYANIEYKFVMVVSACKHFHTYLYECSVTVNSAHKPLELTALNNLTAAPSRLQ